MIDHNSSSSIKARQDFERARRLADLRIVMARFTGQPIGLLSYEDVRQKMKAYGGVSRGLQDIPLDAIIGSVGRYSEFTRDFLPLQDDSENRWVKIKIAVDEPSGLPHIEVYKISDTYFVLDGHHRVSVARQMGSKYIQANVIEINSQVPLTPDVKPDDLIIKAEYADFLEKFRINQLRQNPHLSITAPGGYRMLEEHIEVHRYYMGIELQRFISPEEAFTHWYDSIYLPVAQTIRERGILREFPNRTETDLYLWIAEHRAALEKELGWEINPEAAATDLAAKRNPKRERITTRLTEKIWDTLIPEEFEGGPPPGEWRQQKIKSNESSLFSDLLIPVSSNDESWDALRQALVIAKREKSIIHGLHILQDEEEKNNPDLVLIEQVFDQTCQEAQIPGKLVITSGKISTKICDWARWVDLLVISLKYPPPTKISAKFSSGFSSLIRRCPRPILAVPGTVTEMNTSLLAYDGSPKAREALYLSAYLASKWGLQLNVITVIEPGKVSDMVLNQVRDYLNNLGVHATFVEGSGEVGSAILDTAQTTGSDVIIMGGYGQPPIIEITLGSSVDQILRECSQPVLICR